MIYIEATMLAVLCTLGAYCAVSDIRTQLIPNRAIVAALICGAILHGFNILIGGTEYYFNWIINMFIANLVAILFYIDQVWAPGDVKLFATCYFLLPPRLFDSFTLQYSVTPFLIFFSLAMIYVIIDTIIRMIRHEKWINKHHFSLRLFISGFLSTLIESSGAFFLIILLVPGIEEHNGLFVSFIVLIYILTAAGKPFFRKWIVVAIHGIPIVIYWITRSIVIPLPDWKTLIVMVIALGMKSITSRYNYQCIATSEVKPRMIISADTISLFYTSKVHDLPQDISENFSARITEENAEAIKRWEHSAKGKPEIWIVRKIPFGIMIFTGMALWIAIRLWG